MVLTSGVFVVLPWSVVDGTNVLVIVMVGVVVSRDGVVVSWTVVVLASAVVVALLHLHNCGGQKGVA